jgi:hypothetical protein
MSGISFPGPGQGAGQSPPGRALPTGYGAEFETFSGAVSGCRMSTGSRCVSGGPGGGMRTGSGCARRTRGRGCELHHLDSGAADGDGNHRQYADKAPDTQPSATAANGQLPENWPSSGQMHRRATMYVRSLQRRECRCLLPAWRGAPLRIHRSGFIRGAVPAALARRA